MIPTIHGDNRGFFLETYRQDVFEETCGVVNFVQDNHSGSRQGTLRGLHYQLRNAQGKLVRAVFGEIYDVAVDIRPGSPTFAKWVGSYLSAENKHQLWIPPGFAHGFYVLSDWAEIIYKTSDYYAPEWERSIRWNDPKIGIQWPLIDRMQPTLSKRDSLAPFLDQAELYPRMTGNNRE